jgi:hypothetical protein
MATGATSPAPVILTGTASARLQPKPVLATSAGISG